MALVGTVRGYRRELPQSLTSHHHKNLYSIVYAVNNDNECKVLLVSYIAKRNKVVNLISITQRKNDSYRSIQKQKTDVGVYCNKIKGDADATD